MKTTIYIGKKNTKGHSKIELELKEKEKGLCFSASGASNYQPVFHTGQIYWDYEGYGQCLEDIAKDNPQNKDVQVIVDLWRKHHLNDMNAGTPKQKNHLKSLGKYKSYEWACDELSKVGLLHDNSCLGYKYGCAWLYHEIPSRDIKLIKSLINKYKN